MNFIKIYHNDIITISHLTSIVIVITVFNLILFNILILILVLNFIFIIDLILILIIVLIFILIINLIFIFILVIILVFILVFILVINLIFILIILIVIFLDLVLVIILLTVLILIIVIGGVVGIHLIWIIILEIGCVKWILVQNWNKLWLELLMDNLVICEVIGKPGMLEEGVYWMWSVRSILHQTFLNEIFAVSRHLDSINLVITWELNCTELNHLG